MNNKVIPVRVCTKSIRGLDLELYREARKQSLVEGVTIGQWISQAISERLENIYHNKTKIMIFSSK